MLLTCLLFLQTRKEKAFPVPSAFSCLGTVSERNVGFPLQHLASTHPQPRSSNSFDFKKYFELREWALALDCSHGLSVRPNNQIVASPIAARRSALSCVELQLSWLFQTKRNDGFAKRLGCLVAMGFLSVEIPLSLFG